MALRFVPVCIMNKHENDLKIKTYELENGKTYEKNNGLLNVKLI